MNLKNTRDESGKVATLQRIDGRILPSAKAMDLLKREPADTNAILHVTC